MTYVFLANGSEEMGALIAMDLLRCANVPVQAVGVGGKQVTGSYRIPVTTGIEEHKITLGDLEMAVLPDGLPGVLNLERSETVRNTVEGRSESGRYVVTICAAPSILRHMGLFQGKRVTISGDSQSGIIGAEYAGDFVTVNGRITTGKELTASANFALQLTDLLAERETAQKVRSAVQCR